MRFGISTALTGVSRPGGPDSSSASLRSRSTSGHADANPEGVALYATLGASARPMVGRDANLRVEIFLGLVPERDEVASPLAALGLCARTV